MWRGAVKALGHASIILATLIGAVSWLLAVCGGLLNESSNALSLLAHWLSSPED